MKRKRRQHGQSTAEYAIVIAVVIGAVVGMQTYVRRALNARIKDAADTRLPGNTEQVLTGIDPASGNPITTPVFATGQFEPIYAHSASKTTSDLLSKDASGVTGPIKVSGTSGQVSKVTGQFDSTTRRDTTAYEAGCVSVNPNDCK